MLKTQRFVLRTAGKKGVALENFPGPVNSYTAFHVEGTQKFGRLVRLTRALYAILMSDHIGQREIFFL